MTLDEAIKHAEEVAEEQEKAAKEWHENQVIKCELIPFAEMDYTHENECKECAAEHRQLAEWLKDYKRLLEQETCEDAISRKEVIDTIYHECSVGNLNIDFVKVILLQRKIKALPSVNPQPKTEHWISVDTRLPESDGYYRVIEKSGRVCTYVFHKKGNSEEYWKRCIIAWMPLLESYKEESGGEI